MSGSSSSPEVLVVSTTGEVAPRIQAACRGIARVVNCSDFFAARQQLLERPPALLVTDLRLGAYNGLHLAYVVRTSGLPTRTVVFADPIDLALAREAQAIGAFYEWPHRLPFAVRAYITATLPPRDRRDPAAYDRRHEFRGGRRSADRADLFGT